MTPCENKDKLKPGEGLVDSIATQQPFPACCSCSPPRKQLKGQILDFPASLAARDQHKRQFWSMRCKGKSTGAMAAVLYPSGETGRHTY